MWQFNERTGRWEYIERGVVTRVLALGEDPLSIGLQDWWRAVTNPAPSVGTIYDPYFGPPSPVTSRNIFTRPDYGVPFARIPAPAGAQPSAQFAPQAIAPPSAQFTAPATRPPVPSGLHFPANPMYPATAFVGPAQGRPSQPTDYKRTLMPWQYNPESVKRVFNPQTGQFEYDVSQARVPQFNPKTGRVEGANAYAEEGYAGILRNPADARKYLTPDDILQNETFKSVARRNGFVTPDQVGELGKGVAYHILKALDQFGAKPADALRKNMDGIVDEFALENGLKSSETRALPPSGRDEWFTPPSYY